MIVVTSSYSRCARLQTLLTSQLPNSSHAWQANYLLHPSTSSSPPRIQVLLLSTLSRDPSTRFSELFSERAKWKSDDMKPFLDGLAVDDKGRDKLVLKFVRKMRDADGEIWAKR